MEIRYAADLVVAHFANESVESYFSRPEFSDFMKRVGDMTWREASLEYGDITGEGVMPSGIAAEIARRLVLPESTK